MNQLKKQICRSITTAIWEQKRQYEQRKFLFSIQWTSIGKLVFLELKLFIKHLFLEFEFFHMTTIKNLHFWNSFSYCSILLLTWTFSSFWNHSLQSPTHSWLLDWKKCSFTVTATDQAFPKSNHLCYSQMIKRKKKVIP